MSPKRTAVENAERRMRAWTNGEHKDSDLAADMRTVLAELECMREENDELRGIVDGL